MKLAFALLFAAVVLAGYDFKKGEKDAEKNEERAGAFLRKLKRGHLVKGGRKFMEQYQRELAIHIDLLKLLKKKTKGKVSRGFKKLLKHVRKAMKDAKASRFPGRKDIKRMKKELKAVNEALKVQKTKNNKRGIALAELKLGRAMIKSNLKLAKEGKKGVLLGEYDDDESSDSTVFDTDDLDVRELEDEDDIVCGGICLGIAVGAISGSLVGGSIVAKHAITTPPRRGCLAADGVVPTLRGDVSIADLVLGDSVMTGNGFEKVYLIRDESTPAEVLKATTSESDFAMTPHHLVHTTRGRIAMRDLKTGDEVYVKGEPSKVLTVDSTVSKVRAPQTPSGTIVVNNVLVSTYTTSTATQIELAVTLARPLFYILPGSVQASLAEVVYLLTKV